MCGGIAFATSKIPKKELKKYYGQKEIEKFDKNSVVESYFWDPHPILPVEKDGETKLVMWGNRSDELKLPKTGWAKKESVEDGKWAHLSPGFVNIPVVRGYEKGVWFDVKSGNFRGIEVEKDGERRVYMMTEPAKPEYIKMTKHNRQPSGL